MMNVTDAQYHRTLLNEQGGDQGIQRLILICRPWIQYRRSVLIAINQSVVQVWIIQR